MASVYKRNGGKYWYASWQDAGGKWHCESTKQTDKATAQRIANKKAGDMALRREGVIDHRTDRYSAEGRRPLTEHIDDYEQELKSRNRDPKYVRQTISEIRKLTAIAKAKSVSDLMLSGIQAAIGKILGDGKPKRGNSARTLNSFIRSVKSFSKWLKDDRRISEDALCGLKMYDEDSDRRNRYREITAEEIDWLILATGRKEATNRKFAIGGPDREMLYRIAFGTGYRAKELRSLTPESFDLDSEQPAIMVKAGDTKNGSQAVQPITAALAESIRPWLADKPARQILFPGITDHMAERLGWDMAFARKLWLAEAKTRAERAKREATDFLAVVNHAGEKAVFHSTRHSYISAIVASGASVKTCQELARHSTPTLTIQRYAHTRSEDKAKAIAGLPPVKSSAENMQKTARGNGQKLAADCGTASGKNDTTCTSGRRSKHQKEPGKRGNLQGIATSDHAPLQCGMEGKRMVSGLIRNQLLGNQLRVRLPCPPLLQAAIALNDWRPCFCALVILGPPVAVLPLY
jgi:integrase/recombinase XerD